MIILINKELKKQAIAAINKNSSLSSVPKENWVYLPSEELNGNMLFLLGVFKNESNERKAKKMLLETSKEKEIKERSKRMLKEIKSAKQLEFGFNNKENIQRTETPLEKLYKESERNGGVKIINAPIAVTSAPRVIKKYNSTKTSKTSTTIRVSNQKFDGQKFVVFSQLLEFGEFTGKKLIPVTLRRVVRIKKPNGEEKIIEKTPEGFLYSFQDKTGNDWTLLETSENGVKLIPIKSSILSSGELKLTGFSREFISYELDGYFYKLPAFSFKRGDNNYWAISMCLMLLKILKTIKFGSYVFKGISIVERESDKRHFKAFLFVNLKTKENILIVARSRQNTVIKIVDKVKDFYYQSELKKPDKNKHREFLYELIEA